MFENKKVYVKAIDEEVYVSRIIASWQNVGGNVHNWTFLAWMDKIGIAQVDQNYIRNFVLNGKMELEQLAIGEMGTKED